MSALQLAAQLGVTYKTAWLLAQKLRRSMIDPDRSLLEGVVEVDQTEIPFRTDDAFFDPRQAGKIIVAGAVEVVDRTTNRAKPRKLSAKYLDTRSGRVRLAAIPDNSAASLHAFIRANVRLGLRCSPTATAPIRASPATATIHARSARWRATSLCHGFIASSR